MVLTLVTARSLIRPMRRLEGAAEETAERRLPSVVQRLQDGEQVDLEAESAPPIEVRSKDEIGHLAEAFNSVHRVAVRVAGREAALRRSVGDMFLNLARRSQSLIERQLEVIDELEVSGSEAEVRAGLGELDHLATRMRRNAENLIILSGSEPARRWRGPSTSPRSCGPRSRRSRSTPGSSSCPWTRCSWPGTPPPTSCTCWPS